MALFQLLAPSLSGQAQAIKKDESTCASSASHATFAVAVAIIVGTGAALAAYFFTHGVLMWTAVTGGGAVASSLVSYAIMRCTCGRKPHDMKDSIDLNIARSNQLEGDEQTDTSEIETIQQDSLPIPFVPSTQKGQKQTKKADVKGTVYISSRIGGPIRHDRHFEFSKRIRDENGNLTHIEEDAIYLEIDGTFETKKWRIKDNKGLYSPSIYLPTTLFEGVTEGETVRFFLDDQLIELSCHQKDHPDPEIACLAFEEYLNTVKAFVRDNCIQALWQKDLEGEPTFMGKVVGRSLTLLDIAHDTKTEIQDFRFFEEDQKKHGAYQKLEVICLTEKSVLFNIRRGGVLDFSDMTFIESKGFNSLHQLWLLIPHKPEQNRRHKNVNGASGRHGRTTDRASFNPKKGGRLPTYVHGQYFKCRLHQTNQINLFFNSKGWLQLDLV